MLWPAPGTKLAAATAGEDPERAWSPPSIAPASTAAPGGTAVFEGHYENPMWIDTHAEPDGTSTVDVAASSSAAVSLSDW